MSDKELVIEPKADLCGANLREADLSGADLHYTDLSGADLHYTDLSGADLHYTDLSKANLYKANLSGANLYKANLSGANLRYADLSGANLRYCRNLFLLPVADPRGYSFPHAVLYDDGWRIRAGCRDFSIAEAREHWGREYEGEREIADMYLHAIDWAETHIAKMEAEQ